MLPCAFAQADLIHTAYHLIDGVVWLPDHGLVGKIPLCPLKDMGSLGPDARDIHDGFSVGETKTPYSAFWGHKLGNGFCMNQSSNAYLCPLPRAKPGRTLGKVEDLWPLSGDILLTERMRLNSQGIIAVKVPKAALSSVWWSLALNEDIASDDHKKALVMWFNSSLYLVPLLANRVETEGAWVKFKKPTLHSLPVIDLRELETSIIRTLSETYDKIKNETFLTFRQIGSDQVRAGIDGIFADLFDLGDVSVLRKLLSSEPILSLERL